MILSRRANDDDSRDGFTKWPFMTTHTWGEYPQGTWTLEVRTLRYFSPSRQIKLEEVFNDQECTEYLCLLTPSQGVYDFTKFDMIKVYTDAYMIKEETE